MTTWTWILRCWGMDGLVVSLLAGWLAGWHMFPAAEGTAGLLLSAPAGTAMSVRHGYVEGGESPIAHSRPDSCPPAVPPFLVVLGPRLFLLSGWGFPHGSPGPGLRPSFPTFAGAILLHFLKKLFI